MWVSSPFDPGWIFLGEGNCLSQNEGLVEELFKGKGDVQITKIKTRKKERKKERKNKRKKGTACDKWPKKERKDEKTEE